MRQFFVTFFLLTALASKGQDNVELDHKHFSFQISPAFKEVGGTDQVIFNSERQVISVLDNTNINSILAVSQAMDQKYGPNVRKNGMDTLAGWPVHRYTHKYRSKSSVFVVDYYVFTDGKMVTTISSMWSDEDSLLAAQNLGTVAGSFKFKTRVLEGENFKMKAPSSWQISTSNKGDIIYTHFTKLATDPQFLSVTFLKLEATLAVAASKLKEALKKENYHAIEESKFTVGNIRFVKLSGVKATNDNKFEKFVQYIHDGTLAKGHLTWITYSYELNTGRDMFEPSFEKLLKGMEMK